MIRAAVGPLMVLLWQATLAGAAATHITRYVRFKDQCGIHHGIPDGEREQTISDAPHCAHHRAGPVRPLSKMTFLAPWCGARSMPSP